MNDSSSDAFWHGRRPPLLLQLAQMGSLSSDRWAERLAPTGLTRGEAVVLRVAGQMAEASQRDVAEVLGIVPSRIVVLIDALERRGLLRRVRSTEDRRRHTLEMTDAGREVFHEIARLGASHHADITAPLSDVEREHLADLLAKLVAHHGVHPGMYPGI